MKSCFSRQRDRMDEGWFGRVLARRQAIFLLFAVAALAVLGGCNRYPEGAIVKTGGPPSAAVLESALDELGVKVQTEVFTCVVPKSGWLRLAIEEYRNGEDVRTRDAGRIKVEKGFQEMALIITRRDKEIKFRIEENGLGLGSGAISIEPSGARVAGWIAPGKLLEDQATPLYFLGANEHAISSPRDGASIDELASQYDFLVVVSLEFE